MSRRPGDKAPPPPPEILFSPEQIAARVDELAKEIAAAPVCPQIAMPILVGGFVFAADLVRALAREGVTVDIEMLWLRSYGDKRVASAVSMIAGPSEDVIQGRDVLIIDGVLDMGRTVRKATQLILAAGAASVQVAVMLDKQRKDVAKADYVGFTVGPDFVVGYGTDDAGKYRGLPYIGKVTD